jgi:hypothetical protein
MSAALGKLVQSRDGTGDERLRQLDIATAHLDCMTAQEIVAAARTMEPGARSMYVRNACPGDSELLGASPMEPAEGR